MRLIICLIFCIAFNFSNAQIAFDNNAVVKIENNTNSMILPSVIIPNGLDRLFVLNIGMRQATNSGITSIVYNGVTLTQAISYVYDFNSNTQYQFSEIWYGLMGSGNSICSDVDITFETNSNFVIAVGSSFHNVDQLTPIGDSNFDNATSTSPAQIILTTNSDNMVLDNLYTGSGPISHDPQQNLIANINNGRFLGCSYKSSSSLNTTMTWTKTTSSSGTYVAVELNSSNNPIGEDLIFYVGNSPSIIGQIGFNCEVDSSYISPYSLNRDLVIDTSDQSLYFTSGGVNGIAKIDFDGSNSQIIFTNSNGEVGDLAQKDSLLFFSTSNGTIGSVKKDGTNPQILNTNSGNATGIAIDNKNAKIYWCNIITGDITRSDLDGLNESVILTVTQPIRLALDTIAEKIYWIERGGSNTIKRSNYDGSSIESLVSLDAFGTGIELDLVNNKIYWTQENKSLRRSNLNGSFIEIISNNLPGGGGVAINITNVKLPSVNNMFHGAKSNNWNNPFNWVECQTPEYNVTGCIVIDSTCLTPQIIQVQPSGSILINKHQSLEMKN